MEWKEYLKEQFRKVEEQSEDGAALGVYIDEDTKFMFHDDCFADLQDDFVILYDKKADVNMALPYENIRMVQYINEEIMRKQVESLDFETFLKKVLKD